MDYDADNRSFRAKPHLERPVSISLEEAQCFSTELREKFAHESVKREVERLPGPDEGLACAMTELWISTERIATLLHIDPEEARQRLHGCLEDKLNSSLAGTGNAFTDRNADTAESSAIDWVFTRTNGAIRAAAMLPGGQKAFQETINDFFRWALEHCWENTISDVKLQLDDLSEGEHALSRAEELESLLTDIEQLYVLRSSTDQQFDGKFSNLVKTIRKGIRTAKSIDRLQEMASNLGEELTSIRESGSKW